MLDYKDIITKHYLLQGLGNPARLPALLRTGRPAYRKYHFHTGKVL
jgi:hypothetical protein